MYKYLIYIFIILILVLFLAFIAWCLKKKSEGICPFCVLRQHILKSKLTMHVPEGCFYDGGDALTPPMGWSSWNTFRNKIDEKLIEETADALVATGLADAGYRYVNLDDCWHSSMRDKNGRLQGDLVRFSSGIDVLAEKIRSKGLKIGLYTSNGDYTCEDLPASLGYEKTDAQTFADWGVEYFKYDFCHNVKIPSVAPLIEAVEIKQGDEIHLFTAEMAALEGMARIETDKKLKTGKYISFLGHGKGKAIFEFNAENNGECFVTLCVKKCGRYEKYIVVQVNDKYYELFIPYTKSWSPDGRYQLKITVKKGKNIIKLFNPVCTRADSAYIQYKRMGEELKNASFERKITYSICEWGKNTPEDWAWNAGNLWRMSPDILPNWKWINTIYNMNLKLGEYAGPGHWNDPDMLEVGNGKLTFEENKTHFILWCMMASPLILGNDIRKLANGDKKDILELLKNKELISVNQDKLGKQCVRYKKTSKTDFLYKELAESRVAVCVYNKADSTRKITFDSAELPDSLHCKGASFRDVFNDKIIDSQAAIELPAHGSTVFITV